MPAIIGLSIYLVTSCTGIQVITQPVFSKRIIENKHKDDIVISMEKEMNDLYKRIAETVNDMIPIDWSNFYFNGEVQDEEGGVFFFFKTKDNKSNPVFSHDIPELYDVNEKTYTKELHKLFVLTSQLQKYSLIMIKNLGFRLPYYLMTKVN